MCKKIITPTKLFGVVFKAGGIVGLFLQEGVNEKDTTVNEGTERNRHRIYLKHRLISRDGKIQLNR